ncbi:hypothetical protein GCK32_011744 [Trichostrongylus colubriformis]|uniref:Uncharacterized protein n=1 Tax=Trichostrongylus colubriformis TaxID=6319 RepID=A0AAN8IMA4_TRICO
MRDHGVYNNYGLEICMGLSLLCGAVASTIYHLCPNSITYNLDTPFIQLLCILIILKLFGNRRETVKAQTVNMAAVFVIFVNSIITMFAKRSLTRSLVIICLPFLVLVAISKVFRPTLSPGRRGIATKRPLFVSLIAITVNILMAITFILPADRIQSNQIVTVICLINAFLYFVYYVFSKWCFGEQLCQFSRICSAVAVFLWISALYFFLVEETDWALTPAQSRARNRPCVLMSFFDYHDLWHITSALASLVTLMAVSTIDDAVSALPRGALAVF